MDAGSARRVTLGRTLLRLGRISNLPTVWSNCLAAAGLATARAADSDGALVASAAGSGGALVASAALAMSFVYTGGMFLNDAFDREHDRIHAPERPIPAGAIRPSTVLGLGFLQLLVGIVGIGLASARVGTGDSPAAIAAAIALVLFVVLYDLWHKQNPLSPLLMAGCRVLVYATVGLLVSGGHAQPVLWLGAALMLLYVVGLTWLAKAEARGLHFGRVGGFATLIAGISLVDAALLCAVGRWDWAGLAVLGFPSTLFLQRWVRGT